MAYYYSRRRTRRILERFLGMGRDLLWRHRPFRRVPQLQQGRRRRRQLIELHEGDAHGQLQPSWHRRGMSWTGRRRLLPGESSPCGVEHCDSSDCSHRHSASPRALWTQEFIDECCASPFALHSLRKLFDRRRCSQRGRKQERRSVEEASH